MFLWETRVGGLDSVLAWADSGKPRRQIKGTGQQGDLEGGGGERMALALQAASFTALLTIKRRHCLHTNVSTLLTPINNSTGRRRQFVQSCTQQLLIYCYMTKSREHIQFSLYSPALSTVCGIGSCLQILARVQRRKRRKHLCELSLCWRPFNIFRYFLLIEEYLNTHNRKGTGGC